MKKATTITTTEIDKKNLQCGDVTCDVSCVFFRLSLEVHGMSTLGLLLLTIGDVDNQYPSKDWRLVSFFATSYDEYSHNHVLLLLLSSFSLINCLEIVAIDVGIPSFFRDPR